MGDDRWLAAAWMRNGVEIMDSTMLLIQKGLHNCVSSWFFCCGTTWTAIVNGSTHIRDINKPLELLVSFSWALTEMSNPWPMDMHEWIWTETRRGKTLSVNSQWLCTWQKECEWPTEESYSYDWELRHPKLGPGRGDEVHRLPDSVLHRFTIYVPPVTRDFFLGRGVKRTETIDGRRPEEAAAESRAFIPSQSGGWL